MFALQVKDMGEDFVFEDKDEASDVWTHEQRLRQNASMYLQALSPVKIDAIAKPANWLLVILAGDAAPSEVKGALDPDQGNVISAYSSDSGDHKCLWKVFCSV